MSQRASELTELHVERENKAHQEGLFRDIPVHVINDGIYLMH